MNIENKNDGFSMAGTQSGYITYREGAKTLEICWETSGIPAKYDVILSPVNLKEWKDPVGERISAEDQKRILFQLREWFNEKKIRTDIDLPQAREISDKDCVSPDCKNKAIKDSAFCLQHLDESALAR